MVKLNFSSRTLLVAMTGLSVLCSGALAQGHGNQNNRGGNDRGDNRQYSQERRQSSDHRGDNGKRYHYRDGRWYSRGWFGWEFAVAALAVGAMIESLPPNHSTLVENNTTYYYDNARYYRQTPDGYYIVVQAPR